MSKFIVTIQRTDYIPEGNYSKQSTVFQQEFTDEDAVRRVAIAVNTTMDIKDIMTELRIPG
jgi:hypothetical protein